MQHETVSATMQTVCPSCWASLRLCQISLEEVMLVCEKVFLPQIFVSYSPGPQFWSRGTYEIIATLVRKMRAQGIFSKDALSLHFMLHI